MSNTSISRSDHYLHSLCRHMPIWQSSLVIGSITDDKECLTKGVKSISSRTIIKMGRKCQQIAEK